MKCCSCLAEFNKDWKAEHEKVVHKGMHVQIKTLDAPDSPFALAATIAKRKATGNNKPPTCHAIVVNSAGTSTTSSGSSNKSVSNELSTASSVLFNEGCNETELDTESLSDIPKKKGKFDDIMLPVARITDASTNASSSAINLSENFLEANFSAQNNVSDSISTNISNKDPDYNSDVFPIDETGNISPAVSDSGMQNLGTQDNSEYSDVSGETSDVSWVGFLSQVSFLMDKCSNLSSLVKKFENQDIPSERLCTLELMESLTNIGEVYSEALFTGKKLLKSFENKIKVIESSSQNLLVDHDPGNRPLQLSDNQKKYLILLGPHQPRLSFFPKDKEGLRFKGSWYTEFPHLEYSIVKDAAYCFPCSLFPKGPGREKSNPAWYEDGVQNWRKMKNAGEPKGGKLPAHFGSISHSAALSEFCHFSLEQGHIDKLLDSRAKKLMIENEKVKMNNVEVIKIMMDICKTLGRQGLAFRGSARKDSSEEAKQEEGNYLQFIKLMSRHNLVMRDWIENKSLRPYKTTYFSPQSQNEFISLIGQELKNLVLSKIKKSPFFLSYGGYYA